MKKLSKISFDKKLLFLLIPLLIIVIPMLTFILSENSEKTARAAATSVNLSDQTGDKTYTIDSGTNQDGIVFTGSAINYVVTIEVKKANANITFSGVTISKLSQIKFQAGATSANTIFLVGENNFTPNGSNDANILIDQYTNLTVTGYSGSLNMQSNKPCIAFANHSDSTSSAEINIKDTTVTLANNGIDTGSTLGLLPGSSSVANSTTPGKINIVGSTISAVVKMGAGIGGGYNHSKEIIINITNCYEIFAQCIHYGAGIGGGNLNAKGTVNITSVSSISAIGGATQYSYNCGGAGIGGGHAGSLGNVTITSVSSIKCNGGNSTGGAGIGGGSNSSGTVKISSVSSISANGSRGAGIGGGGGEFFCTRNCYYNLRFFN